MKSFTFNVEAKLDFGFTVEAETIEEAREKLAKVFEGTGDADITADFDDRMDEVITECGYEFNSGWALGNNDDDLDQTYTIEPISSHTTGGQ